MKCRPSLLELVFQQRNGSRLSGFFQGLWTSFLIFLVSKVPFHQVLGFTIFLGSQQGLDFQAFQRSHQGPARLPGPTFLISQVLTRSCFSSFPRLWLGSDQGPSFPVFIMSCQSPIKVSSPCFPVFVGFNWGPVSCFFQNLARVSLASQVPVFLYAFNSNF